MYAANSSCRTTRLRWSALALGAVWSILSGTVVQAQPDRSAVPIRPGEVRRVASHCSADVVEAIAERMPDADSLRLYRAGRVLIREVSFAGSGVTGASDCFYSLLDLDTCALTELQEVRSANALYITSWSDGEGAPPSLEQVRSATRERLDALDPTRPEHALAALLADPSWTSRQVDNPELRICGLVEETSPVVVPVAVAEQPWHPGRPLASPALYVPATGDYVPRTGRPRRTLRGDDIEIYTVNLPSRYAGTAIAVYRPAEDRHRWLFVTRECALGPVQWLGRAGASWVLGVASGTHSAFPTSIFAIDVARARVRWIGVVEMTFDGVPERFPLCRTPGGRACVSATLRADALDVRRCDRLTCRVRSYPLECLLRDLDRNP